MRILLFTGMYPFPGNSVNGAAVARQRESLQSLGVEVDLLHARPHGKHRGFHTLLALQQLSASGRYALVHAHYGLTTTLMAVSQPLPLVLTFHGTDINGRPYIDRGTLGLTLKASAAALTTRQLARRADAVIVMTPSMKFHLPQAVQARTFVEPLGVDTSLFYQRPRKEARSILGWGNEPVVIFCSSHGDTIKRPDLAEAAVKEASQRLPGLRLFMLHGLEPAEVPLVLSAGDCLLITSDREGSPNIVKESLACNLPIVSVSVGDVPEILASHPLAGVIVRREPALLGKALAEIIQRPRPGSLTELMLPYSQEVAARRIIKIYEEVLSQRRSRK